MNDKELAKYLKDNLKIKIEDNRALGNDRRIIIYIKLGKNILMSYIIKH